MAKVDRIFFDSSKMKNVSDNVQSYIREQDFLIIDFEQILSDISSCYRSDNSNKISELNDIIIGNMDKIKENYQRDISLFDKIDKKYKETNEEVDQIFRNIGKSDK